MFQESLGKVESDAQEEPIGYGRAYLGEKDVHDGSCSRSRPRLADEGLHVSMKNQRKSVDAVFVLACPDPYLLGSGRWISGLIIKTLDSTPASSTSKDPKLKPTIPARKQH